MQTEEEVKNQLVDIYKHRLMLRVERKTKRICRNCKHGFKCEFDCGDFGVMSKWVCKYGKSYNDCCEFDCLYTQKEIEDEMIQDISDPAICGAKEPKIAMLMWVLHNSKGGNAEMQNLDGNKEQGGIFNIIREWFAK